MWKCVIKIYLHPSEAQTKWKMQLTRSWALAFVASSWFCITAHDDVILSTSSWISSIASCNKDLCLNHTSKSVVVPTFKCSLLYWKGILTTKSRNFVYQLKGTKFSITFTFSNLFKNSRWLFRLWPEIILYWKGIVCCGRMR